MSHIFSSVLITRSKDHLHLCSFDAPGPRGIPQRNIAKEEYVQKILSREFKAKQVGLGRNPPGPGEALDVHGVYRSYDAPNVIYYVHADPPVPTDAADHANFPFQQFSGITTALIVDKTVDAFRKYSTSIIQTAACDLLRQIHTDFARLYPASVTATATKTYHMIKFDMNLQSALRNAQGNLSRSASLSSNAPGMPNQGQLINRNAPRMPAPTSNHSGATPPQAVSSQHASGDVLQEITGELNIVQDLVKRSLADVLVRGEKMETLETISNNLASDAQGFKLKTKNLNKGRNLMLYGPPAVLLLVITLYLWFRFFVL